MPLIEIPKDARKGKPPCGECHLKDGETCDICGAHQPVRATVHIDALTKRADLPDCGETEGKCPTCGNYLQTGFGLAGGGYGVYEYCDNDDCQKVVTKTETD